MRLRDALQWLLEDIRSGALTTSDYTILDSHGRSAIWLSVGVLKGVADLVCESMDEKHDDLTGQFNLLQNDAIAALECLHKSVTQSGLLAATELVMRALYRNGELNTAVKLADLDISFEVASNALDIRKYYLALGNVI